MSSVNELSLADLSGGEVVLDISEPINTEEVRFQAQAKAAGEPFVPQTRWGHKGLGILQEGDLLEVYAPSYRKAKVLKVMGKSAVVECSVMRNQPYWPKGSKRPEDRWTVLAWKEAWAVRAEEYVDSRDPRRKWTEYHCLVTQEDRPHALRRTSGLIGSYVQAGRDPQPDVYFGGPDADQKEPERPAVDMLTGEATGGVSPQAPSEQPAPTDAVGSPIADPANATIIHAKPKYMQALKMAKAKGVDTTGISGAGAVDKILALIAEKDNGKD